MIKQSKCRSEGTIIENSESRVCLSSEEGRFSLGVGYHRSLFVLTSEEVGDVKARGMLAGCKHIFMWLFVKLAVKLCFDVVIYKLKLKGFQVWPDAGSVLVTVFVVTLAAGCYT